MSLDASAVKHAIRRYDLTQRFPQTVADRICARTFTSRGTFNRWLAEERQRQGITGANRNRSAREAVGMVLACQGRTLDQGPAPGTAREVAAEAGVSLRTLWRVVAEARRER